MSDVINYFIREFQGIKIIELNGNLDVNTIEVFKSVVEKIAQKESLMINMENVRMVSSSGLNALLDISFYAKEYGRRVILLWPSEDLLSMTETAEVYNHLIFAQSLEEGQTKIKFFT